MKGLLYLVMVAAMASAARADDEDAAVTPPAPAIVGVESVREAEPAKVKLGEYWLGVACRLTGDAADRARDLSEAAGLVIERVVPETPAAAAGMKPGDAVLEADGVAMKGVEQFVEAVNAAKDREMTIVLLRDGERISVKATPAKRPPAPDVQAPAEAEMQKAMQWLEQFRREAGARSDDTLRWHSFGPGLIVRSDAGRRPIPDDMTVTIRKTGNKPAEISVVQGDKTWTATDEKLDSLPAEVRPHVEGMLGRLPAPFADRIRVFETPPGGPPLPAPRVERILPRPDASIDRRFDEINERIERLGRLIEELRDPPAKNPGEKPVEKPVGEPAP
jgi:membrane-associated protease RseP (regulator of RpoE activity)